MLTADTRLRSSRTFAETVRRGRRSGTRTLVLHLAQGSAQSADRPRIGFVVSKAVGPAVTRNLVKRRLRHLARERLDALPGSAVLVVRALPPSAEAGSGQLAADFDRALSTLMSRSSTPSPPRGGYR